MKHPSNNIQKLIDNNVPFAIISCNTGGMRDIFLVLPSAFNELYFKFLKHFSQNKCDVIDLTEYEKDFFKSNIAKYFVVHKTGSFGTIYERKNNSLKEYFNKRPIRNPNTANKGKDP